MWSVRLERDAKFNFLPGKSEKQQGGQFQKSKNFRTHHDELVNREHKKCHSSNESLFWRTAFRRRYHGFATTRKDQDVQRRADNFAGNHWQYYYSGDPQSYLHSSHHDDPCLPEHLRDVPQGKISYSAMQKEPQCPPWRLALNQPIPP